ncbi:MAG: class I SAM-dependent methyltransferase [Alphaproteobacteria bacterium]|nr:class I SAM-dependent methyltransferase [Alphaproteobacteria bacterium]
MARAQARPALYWELAPWFHLLTHPKSYAGEARWVRPQLLPKQMKAKPSMLELGAGGGNNALHLKKDFTLTLTDVSPRMLALSRTINPTCEHVVGDVRTMRLKRQFDFVFVHDAVCYMTTERDLKRAMKTAFVHCKAGGVALFQPDELRETFRATHERGGHREGDRALRYELSTQLSARTGATARFVVKLKDGKREERTIVDEHHVGVFSRATWRTLLRETGFDARTIVDPWKRECFIATRGV